MLSSPANAARPPSLFKRMGGTTAFGPQPSNMAGFGQQQPQQMGMGGGNINWSQGPGGGWTGQRQQPTGGGYTTQAMGEDGGWPPPMGQPAQHPFAGIQQPGMPGAPTMGAGGIPLYPGGGHPFGQDEIDKAVAQFGQGGAQRSLMKKFGSGLENMPTFG